MAKEVEMLKRAKQYMQHLSQGLDPLDGNPIDEDTFRNEKTIACLSFVCDTLDKLIQQEEKRLSPDTITVSTIAYFINHSLEDSTIKTQPIRINEWLVKEGYLERTEDKQLHPTQKGIQLGIQAENAVGNNGKPYIRNTFSKEAMDFIIKNASSFSTPSYGMTFEGKQYAIETVPGPKLESYISNDTRYCFIMADASADVMAGTGSFLSILRFQEKTKVLRQSNIPSSNKNTLILEGMLAAAKCLKKPVSVILVTGNKLGFDRYEGYRDPLCNDVLHELFQKNCSVRIASSTSQALSKIIANYSKDH